MSTSDSFVSRHCFSTVSARVVRLSVTASIMRVSRMWSIAYAIILENGPMDAIRGCEAICDIRKKDDDRSCDDQYGMSGEQPEVTYRPAKLAV